MYDYLVTQEHTQIETFQHFKAPGSPSINTINRWSYEFLMNRSYKKVKLPNKKGNNRIAPRHVAALGEIVEQEPRLYLDEMRDLLQEKVGRLFHTSTIWRALYAAAPHGLGLTWQVLQRRAREACADERQLFRDATRGFAAEQFIWVDESHCDPKSCHRKRGYQPRGQGRHHHVLENFGPATKRYSLLAAADIDGFVIDACEAVEGGVDADRFVQWVVQRLVPVLGNASRGEARSVVILDNASVHHSLLPLVEALIRECGAFIVFLSPYSPDLNPIEQGFKHLKAFFKRHWSFAPHMLVTGLRSVTAAHMRSFCRHAGVVGVGQLAVRERALAKRRQLLLAILLLLD